MLRKSLAPNSCIRSIYGGNIGGYIRDTVYIKGIDKNKYLGGLGLGLFRGLTTPCSIVNYNRYPFFSSVRRIY